jgi:hypothetical protein
MRGECVHTNKPQGENKERASHCIEKELALQAGAMSTNTCHSIGPCQQKIADHIS